MRVNQQTDYLGSLMREAEKGWIAPAAFQRPYAWGKEEVEAFWSSVLDGLPMGAFLMWRPAEKGLLKTLSGNRIGPRSLADEGGLSLILDGHNRLATLAWSSQDPSAEVEIEVSEREKEVWLSGDVLCADASDRSIRFVAAPEVETGLRAPMHRVLSQGDFWNYVRKVDRSSGRLTDQAIEWLVTIQDRLRESRVIVTTMDNATSAEARSAFLRICRAGVPMSADDFDRAVGWVPDLGIEAGTRPRGP
jgi:hypothetical protein